MIFYLFTLYFPFVSFMKYYIILLLFLYELKIYAHNQTSEARSFPVYTKTTNLREQKYPNIACHITLENIHIFL